jgi:hypothetical protein
MLNRICKKIWGNRLPHKKKTNQVESGAKKKQLKCPLSYVLILINFGLDLQIN